MTPFQVSTDAIDSRTQVFDVRYTCDSDNSSPEVRWSDPPDGTGSLALLMDDPDAPGGTFVHWIIFQIPPNVRHLPAGIPPQETLPNGIRQGLNTAKKLGYFGPCPPHGDSPHRYRLTLFALRGPIAFEGRMTPEDFRRQLGDQVLSETQIVGRYGRTTRRAG